MLTDAVSADHFNETSYQVKKIAKETSMNKRTISGLAAVITAISMLTACTQTSEDNVIPTMSETTTTAAEETTVTEATDLTTAPTTVTVPTTEATTEETTEATTAPQSQDETTTTSAPTGETEATSAQANSWSETQMSGTMYVTTDCYSRERAVIGATPISQHSAGDAVTITAITDTGYYKIAEGGYIHSDYLSTSKPAPATTAPATDAAVEETTTKKKSSGTSGGNSNIADDDTGNVSVGSGEMKLSGTTVTVGDYTFDYTNRYPYKQLNASEQELYRGIVKAAFSFENGVMLPAGLTYTDAVKVFHIVFHSEPELFWLNSSPKDRGTALGLTYKTTDPDEINTMIGNIDANASAILSKAGSSSLTQIMTFYDNIVYRATFSKDASGYNATIYNVLGTKGELQCAGYAKSMQYLCDRVGIDCMVVEGSNSEGSTHAWNVLYCENGYYNVDATWGDPINGQEFGKDYITYDYCLVPDSWIHNLTHFNVSVALRENGNIKLYTPPACTKEAANYFDVYGKLYSDEASATDAIKSQIDTAVANGTNVVEIRVTSKKLYDTMRDTSKWKEFQNYAKGKGNVSKLKLMGQGLTEGVLVVHYDIVYK